MGKLIKVLHKIREMDDTDLLNRFQHIVRAQAVKEYLGTQEDKALSLEVRLAAEEISKRMAARDLHIVKIVEN